MAVGRRLGASSRLYCAGHVAASFLERPESHGPRLLDVALTGVLVLTVKDSVRTPDSTWQLSLEG